MYDHGETSNGTWYDVDASTDGFPLLAALRDDLARTVHDHGAGIRGLTTWVPNEAGIARYRPGSLGITPHLDGRRYRRLVVVVTLYGRARFAICRDRRGSIVSEWVSGPGDVSFLRGPGLGGYRDGRPFHLVDGPRRGSRLSIGFRMNVA